jgi:hypothetical protein
MITEFYLPILKSKLGEFTALSKLENKLITNIVPLFEITPMEWDQAERKKPRSLNDHLDSFCKKLITKWANNKCFVDTHLLNWTGVDDTIKIEYVFDKLAESSISPIPVVSLRSSDEFVKAFNRVTHKNFSIEIGLRVNLNDVSDPEFNDNIKKLLSKVGFPPKFCHLIFDLVDSNFTEVEDFSESILDELEEFPSFAEWKSFSIVGTAFPASKTTKEGLELYARNDWKFYKLLRSKLGKRRFSRPTNFGDYSVVNPEYFEFNPKIMKSSANIRYTHNDYWLIAKGKALTKAADYLQYRKLATGIFNSKYFLGELFSEGDAHLKKVVGGKEKPGAPSIWNWVGNNHHFTKVIKDLFP